MLKRPALTLLLTIAALIVFSTYASTSNHPPPVRGIAEASACGNLDRHDSHTPGRLAVSIPDRSGFAADRTLAGSQTIRGLAGARHLRLDQQIRAGLPAAESRREYSPRPDSNLPQTTARRGRGGRDDWRRHARSGYESHDRNLRSNFWRTGDRYEARRERLHSSERNV